MNIKEEAGKAAGILSNGGVILYPTDTIWGIGCDATLPEAVENIYRLKGRPAAKGLIILVADTDQLKNYVEHIPEKALEIIEQADKPVTIVYEKARNIAHNATAPDGSIAIRIPKDTFCRELIRKLGHPITSTSANTSGIKPPENFQQIEAEIIRSVDHVVSCRQDEMGTARSSSIYKVTKEGDTEVIRE